MKKVIAGLSVIILALSLLYWANAGDLTAVGTGRSKVVVSTYANSDTDTIAVSLTGAENQMSFYIHAKDSVSVANVIVYRMYNGYRKALHTADTLMGSFGFTATTVDTVVAARLILDAANQPTPEGLDIVVVYKSAGNGVTTPTVKYGFVGFRQGPKP